MGKGNSSCYLVWAYIWEKTKGVFRVNNREASKAKDARVTKVQSMF